MNVTFDALVTPAGVVIAAGIITGLIQLLKVSFPILDARVSGATMAFLISLGLYVVVGLAIKGLDANGYLNVFLAWLSAATSAVGIKATIDHAGTASAKADPLTDLVPADSVDA